MFLISCCQYIMLTIYNVPWDSPRYPETNLQHLWCTTYTLNYPPLKRDGTCLPLTISKLPRTEMGNSLLDIFLLIFNIEHQMKCPNNLQFNLEWIGIHVQHELFISCRCFINFCWFCNRPYAQYSPLLNTLVLEVLRLFVLYYRS